jgi:type IV pilus assembly protein PilM
MTKLFYTDKPIIGLDISSTGIKIMAINPKRWLVLGYGSLDLEPIKVKESLEGNSTYLAENIKLLIKEKIVGTLPSNHVVIGVPTSRSYSRTFNLPVSVEHKLKDAVELEVDQYIPIPASTLYIDYKIIERNKKEITVLMGAVSKSIVDKCVYAAESAGLVVSIVEPGMTAVARLLTKTEEGHLPSVIVDIGPASTDIAVLEKDNIRVTGGITVGGNTFTLDIAKKLNVALENAHQLKVLNGLSAGPRQEKIKSALEPSLKRIVAETHKVIRYYSERINENQKLEQLLVVGSGSNMPGIGEYFTDGLIMPARVASPWQKLDFGKLPEPARQFRSRYITVAGLASIDRSEYSKIVNLLPYKSKLQNSAAKANVILVKFTAILGLAAIFLALASGATWMFLNNQNNDAIANTNAKSTEVSTYDAYKSEAQALVNSINTGKSILSRQMSYADIIMGLASYMPEGVILDGLNLDSTTIGNPMSLTLRAKSIDDITKFKDAITRQEVTLFSDYTLQSSNTIPNDATGYNTRAIISLTVNKGIQ